MPLRRLSILAAITPMFWVLAVGLSGCGESSLDIPEPISAGPKGASSDSQTNPSGVSVSGEQDWPVQTETSETATSATLRNGVRSFDLEKATLQELRELTLRALESDQEDVAFQLIRRAVARFPSDTEIVYLQAMILAERHRFRESVLILDELAAKVPQSRIAFLGQTAQWCGEAGQFEEAEKRYREVLKAMPDEPQVHHYLGQMLLQLGRRVEAHRHFSYLSRIGDINQDELRSMLLLWKAFPGDAESSRLVPLSDLAWARQSMGDGSAVEALSRLQEIQTPDAIAFAARIQLLEGDFASAEKLLGGIEILGTNPDYCLGRAMIALNRGKIDEALQFISRAVSLDPSDAECYNQMALIAKEAGQEDVANGARERVKLLRKSVLLGQRLVGDDGENRKSLAELIVVLEQLRRPLEVFGWRSIDLVYAVNAGSISDSVAQERFEAIGRERNALLRSGDVTPDPSFVLCGLRL